MNPMVCGVAAFAAVERERSVWVSCAGKFAVYKSQVCEQAVAKRRPPGVVGRMPCPARPVKDDRVLACASALDPCNSGRCPLSTGGLVRSLPLLAQLCCSLRPAGLLVPSPSTRAWSCLELQRHQLAQTINPFVYLIIVPLPNPTRLPPSQPTITDPGGFSSLVSIPSSIRGTHFQRSIDHSRRHHGYARRKVQPAGVRPERGLHRAG